MVDGGWRWENEFNGEVGACSFDGQVKQLAEALELVLVVIALPNYYPSLAPSHLANTRLTRQAACLYCRATAASFCSAIQS